MTRPRLLDLFCGAGGAAMGYHRAGFDVVGVDIEPQKRFPFSFHRGDAIDYASHHGHEFDAIHASPPCQRSSAATRHLHDGSSPDLIHETREALNETGLPWVIENVPGAPLRNPITLCGLSFGLMVKRHRLFESNVLLFSLPCGRHDVDYFVIFGHEVRSRRHGHAAGRKNSIAAGRAAMDIDWMTRGELSQAIPPAYTEFIGKQLIAAIS
jgi:DNA (cytosine-5)-methyltransferase 1